MSFVACTRMYDVTPDVRRHWHALMSAAAGAAGLAVECIDHAPPAPLTDLWARDDLVLGYMCGLPLATRYPDVQPLAAPVTVCSDDDRPTYRSMWLVRSNSNFDTLASTFGHRIGWTVEHSHSGFNAPRHALLAHRSAIRPLLYRESVGPLGDPRAALEALDEGRIDVTAIDAYWWWLLERYDAATAASYRVVGETASAPIPPLICAAGLAPSFAMKLVEALGELHEDRGAAVRLDALGVRRFSPVARGDYLTLADLDRAAREAGYPLPS
jgi:ABC-type phosphate/phosphonate transport system substrate-binding protein